MGSPLLKMHRRHLGHKCPPNGLCFTNCKRNALHVSNSGIISAQLTRNVNWCFALIRGTKRCTSCGDAVRYGKVIVSLICLIRVVMGLCLLLSQARVCFHGREPPGLLLLLWGQLLQREVHPPSRHHRQWPRWMAKADLKWNELKCEISVFSPFNEQE